MNSTSPHPRAIVQVVGHELNPAVQAGASQRAGSRPSRPVSAVAPDGEPGCDRCRNVRWLVQPDPEGHPGRDKLVPCPACGVVARRRMARFARYSALKGRARRQRFSNFSLAGRAGAATEAFNATLTFAKDPRGWLILYGPNGNGKSHLAAAIANYLLDRRNIPTLFITVPDFLESLRESFRVEGDDGDRYGPRFHAAREAPVLVLDDLGAERQTAWAQEVLFLILDYRYRMELPTVVITNVKPGSLPPRIGSRLADRSLSKVVFNPAPDYRLGEMADNIEQEEKRTCTSTSPPTPATGGSRSSERGAR